MSSFKIKSLKNLIDLINAKDVEKTFSFFDFENLITSEYYKVFEKNNFKYLVFFNDKGTYSIFDLKSFSQIQLFDCLYFNDLIVLDSKTLLNLSENLPELEINNISLKETSLKICLAILTDFKNYLDNTKTIFERFDLKYPYGISLNGNTNQLKDFILFNKSKSVSLFQNGESILVNFSNPKENKVNLFYNPYFLMKNELDPSITSENYILLNKNSRSYDLNKLALEYFSNKDFQFQLIINKEDHEVFFNAIYLFNYFLNIFLNKVFVFTSLSDCKRYVYFNYSWKTSGDIDNLTRKELSSEDILGHSVKTSMININGQLNKDYKQTLFSNLTPEEIKENGNLNQYLKLFKLGTYVNSKNKNKDVVTHKIMNNFTSINTYINHVTKLFSITNFSLIVK